MNPVADKPAAKARKRSGAKAQERKGADRVRCTLILSAETDLKLGVLAMLRGLDRSALADRILSEAVRSVVVSLRGSAAADTEDRHESAA
jgi:hypothetical protein